MSNNQSSIDKLQMNTKEIADNLLNIAKDLDINDETLNILKNIQNANSNLDNKTEQFLKNTLYTNLEFFKDYQKNIYDNFINYNFKNNYKFILDKQGNFDLFNIDEQSYLYNLDVINTNISLCDDFLNKDNTIIKIPFDSAKDWYGQIHHRYLNEIVSILDRDEDSDVHCLNDIKSIPCMLFLGIGLGYIVEEMYKRVDIKHALIVEPDADLFYASLHVIDYKSLIEFLISNNQTISFAIDLKADYFSEFLFNYFLSHNIYINKYMSIYTHYTSDEILKYINVLNTNFSSINVGFGFYDDSIFSVSQGINNLINHKAFALKNCSISSQYNRTPVFIVGNGPSLDQDLDFLRKNQDKALIVACGTALDTLYNQGIQADFYTVTERTYDIIDTIKHLDGTDYLDNIILIGSEVVHDRIAKMFKHTCLFLKDDDCMHLIASLDQDLGSKINEMRHIYLMNPLVSNLAVSSLLNLGFKNIYLFGTDNGTKNKDKMHSDASFLYKEAQLEASGINYRQDDVVEGNFGGEVISNHIFKIAILNISRILSSYRDDLTSIYNCSDGAKIPDIEAKRSSDIDMSIYNDIDKDKFIEYFTSNITKEYEISRDTIINILNYEDFNKIVDVYINALSVIANADSRETILFVIDTLSSTLRKNVQLKECFYFGLIAGSLQTFFVQIVNALYKYKSEEKSLKLCSEIIQRVVYFLEDCKKIFRFLPDYSFYFHREKLNGFLGFDHELSKAPPMPEVYQCIQNEKAFDKVAKFIKRYK